MNAAGTPPLDGITALDLSIAGPGTFCTMALADMGARVIRIERPGADQHTAGGDLPGGYVARDPFNRGKQMVILDLKDPRGRDALQRMVATADVLVEGFRPGVTSRLKIDYGTLSQMNPRLVYCSVSGYGQSGEYADLPGHELNYLAMTGALTVMGPAGQPPVLYPMLGDYGGGGMTSLSAVLGALLMRERTGKGTNLDLAIADSVFYLGTQMMKEYSQSGMSPPGGEGWLNGAAPFYNVYRGSDGRFLTIAAIEPGFWASLCLALELPQLTERQFAQEEWAGIREILGRKFLERSAGEWFDYLRPLNIPVGIVRTIAEAAADPAFQARGSVRPLGQSGITSGPPFGLPRGGGDAPPASGADTREVLIEAGLSAEEVEKLIAAGVATEGMVV